MKSTIFKGKKIYSNYFTTFVYNSNKNHKIQQFAQNLLGLYIFFAPIALYLPPIYGINPIRIVAIAIWIIGLSYLVRGKIEFKFKKIFVLLSIVILARICISFFENDFKDVIITSFPFVTFLAVFIINSFNPSFLKLNKIFRVIIFSSIFASILGLLTYFHILPVPDWRFNVHEKFLNLRLANVLDGIFGVIALSSSLYLLNTSHKKLDRFFVFLGLPSSLIIVIFSAYRSYIIYSLIILLGVVLYHFFYVKQMQSNQIIFIAAVLISITFIIIVIPTEHLDLIKNRFAITGKNYDYSSYVRNLEAEAEKELISNNPFWGYGWGFKSNEKIIYLHSVWGRMENPIYGHNMYLGLTLFNGLFCTLIIFAFFILIIWNCLKKSLLNKIIDKNICTLLWSTFMLGIGFFLVGYVQNLFTMTLSFPLFAIYFSGSLSNIR